MSRDMARHSMCCWLNREPAQVRHARKRAREALSRWGLAGHADLAELIVSELATNAIRHGDGAVHVCVSFARCDLRVEVRDEAAGRWPVRQEAAAEDESGRGLALLDELIGLHGGCRGVTHDGAERRKTVYVVICLAPDQAGPATGTSAACPARTPVTCQHMPRCPGADAADRGAARATVFHPNQGWIRLCNGVVVFDDSGALLPDGTIIEPHCAASQSRANGLLPGQTRPRGAPCRTDAIVREGRTGLSPVRPSPVQTVPESFRKMSGRALRARGGHHETETAGRLGHRRHPGGGKR
jgi:anti-sigma regulatory factor (Ser/Thr protein kinase)